MFNNNLPQEILNVIEENKRMCPNCEFRFYDDNDCYEFIKNNFEPVVLEAYSKINPIYGAMKADFFRYCVLYKTGGIYLDIKYAPYFGFKFINLTEKEHWVLDMDKNGVYNALIVCKPNNEILLKAINKVVENVLSVLIE